ncbi:MAG: two-component system response regulator [Chitinophagaceae bacterium BSSC1]|nr:MAG: two-component system response regulator [Chitinophagaceae bacterium BSSC1]
MKPINILLIEDNDGDILLFKESFEDAGILANIEVLTDGKLALDFFQHLISQSADQFPDLIFLDINLPKKNGHEVLDFLKGQETLKKIPVIMLSTSSWYKDIEKANEAGVLLFISKPFDVDQFLRKITSKGQFSILLKNNQS